MDPEPRRGNMAVVTAPPTSAPEANPVVRRGHQPERKMIITAAVALAGVILGGAVLVAMLAQQPSASAVRQAHADAVAGPPRSIDLPNTGVAPAHPGDRGGWQQITLLVLIMVAVVVVAYAVFRGGSKARAGRAAWRAAAATGRDGAASSPPA